jgi:hypothetical protein
MGMVGSAQTEHSSFVGVAPKTRLTRPAARDVRIAVSAITNARTLDGDCTVRIVGLSAKTALLLSPAPLGIAGQTIDLWVPVVGGHDLEVMAGIAHDERTRDGVVTQIEFIVVEPDVRRQLNELLALLLAGDPDEDAARPRVVYDTLVTYGPTRTQRAFLQEISLTGLTMRVGERIRHDTVVDVTLPPFRMGEPIELRGRVTGQRLSAEGGYITTLDFEPLAPLQRWSLGTLIADLMCR